MEVKQLAGIVVYSRAPQQLVAFYRDKLGLPLAEAEPPVRCWECLHGGVRFAIWSGATPGIGPIVLSFHVDDIDAFTQELVLRGVTLMHPVIEVGEGERLVSFQDPDGNVVRAIETTEPPRSL